MAGITHNEFDMLSESGSIGDFLEPLEAELAMSLVDDVDDMLDAIAREVDDDAFARLEGSGHGSNESINLDLDPVSLAEFTCSLQESLAKFDEFLERANGNGFGDEIDDQLTELKPIQSSREKRGRDHDHGGLNSSAPGSGMSPRIRAISGEQLSSMPAMHHGYATMSSLKKDRSQFTGTAPQKNQAWDTPEPILGEVTGNKMRRLLSDKSYFHSRPTMGAGPTDVTQNAAWGTQTKGVPSNTTRTSMQRLLSGGNSHPARQLKPTVAAARSSGWPAPKPSLGGISLAEMQRLASTGPGSQVASTPSQNFVASIGAVQNSEMPALAPKPAYASVSLQDMQRLAASGGVFPTQAAQPAAPQSSAQNRSTGMSPPKPVFASISLQDAQRRAAMAVAFAAQTSASGNSASKAAPAQSAPWSAPKPAFTAVSLQDMQRLASTGVSFPPQTAAAPGSVTRNAPVAQSAPWSAPAPHSFASVSLQDIQRLASTGVSFPGQAQAGPSASGSGIPTPPWAAPAPAFGTATTQDMHRLASTGLGATSQAAHNSFGSGGQSQSQNNLAQAAPKPAFASVSLEDMQRLANTGVSMPNLAGLRVTAQGANVATQNAPWSTREPSSAAAPMQGLQHSANASSPISSQTAPAVRESDTATSPAPKLTFASVTIEDMQRLVNAYSSATAQTAPAVSASGAHNAFINAPKPGLKHTPAVVSVEEMQRIASTDSVSQGHSSTSESGTQNEVWQSMDVNREYEDVRRKIPLSSAAAASESMNDNVIYTDSTTPPKKVSGGAMQRMLSDASYFQSQIAEFESSGGSNANWAEAVSSKQSTGTDSEGSAAPIKESQQLPSDPDEMLKRLKALMERSSSTQKALQDYDKARGLPRSHSQTMVNSSRSRSQIIENKIIAKWDGSPLISEETELGKPKPRSRSRQKRSAADGNNSTGGIVGGPV